MANNTGYEELGVGSTQAVGPTASLVQGGVACAIFYVDPNSTGIVRHRADRTAPTSRIGLPLRPGKSIVVAGEGNVRNALFIMESGTGTVHCMYYDRVDVVDLGLSSDWSGTQMVSEMQAVSNKLEETLHVLKQIRNSTGSLAFDKIGNDVPGGDN